MNPLSVAAEQIAIVAMRCAGLLQLLDVEERIRGPVIEVYPALLHFLAVRVKTSRGAPSASAPLARRDNSASHLLRSLQPVVQLQVRRSTVY